MKKGERESKCELVLTLVTPYQYGPVGTHGNVKSRPTNAISCTLHTSSNAAVLEVLPPALSLLPLPHTYFPSEGVMGGGEMESM